MRSDYPLIAVSQRVVEVSHRGELRDCLDQQWSVWLESSGFTCVPVPNRLGSIISFLKMLRPRGIILSGGNNLTLPVYQGLEQNRPVGDAYECRDHTEQILMEFAQSRRLPVLGCCRGMQFLNVFFGGRLAPLPLCPVNHSRDLHSVVLTDNAFRGLNKICTLTVNSFHEYGCFQETLAHPLESFALSTQDRVVEGFVHRDLPIAGIMWHPERRSPSAEFDKALLSHLFSRSRSGL